MDWRSATGCSPAYQHRGLATRTVLLLTPAALAHPGITHVEIHTDQANTASAAVAQRAGYTLVGSSPRARRAPAETGVELRWRREISTVTREADAAPDRPGVGFYRFLDRGEVQ